MKVALKNLVFTVDEDAINSDFSIHIYKQAHIPVQHVVGKLFSNEAKRKTALKSLFHIYIFTKIT